MSREDVGSVVARSANSSATAGAAIDPRIVAADAALAAQLRSLANQGRSDSGDWLEHDKLGFNYRMDELSAAVGLAQTERLEEILAARAAVAARYDVLLGIDEEGGDVTRLEWRTGSSYPGGAVLGVLDEPSTTDPAFAAGVRGLFVAVRSGRIPGSL